MTKLKEIADAIYKARCEETEDSEWTDAGFLRQARAAVEAMREPTEAMIAAGNADRDHGCEPGENIWADMIDAILNEKA